MSVLLSSEANAENNTNYTLQLTRYLYPFAEHPIRINNTLTPLRGCTFDDCPQQLNLALQLVTYSAVGILIPESSASGGVQWLGQPRLTKEEIAHLATLATLDAKFCQVPVVGDADSTEALVGLWKEIQYCKSQQFVHRP